MNPAESIKDPYVELCSRNKEHFLNDQGKLLGYFCQVSAREILHPSYLVQTFYLAPSS